MKIKKLLIVFGLALLIAGCGEKTTTLPKELVGEWTLDSTDYFEFFENGTFERRCTNYLCSMIKSSNSATQNKTCIVKGKVELVENKLQFSSVSSNCDLETDNFKYGIQTDYSYFCANEEGICTKGWEKSSDEPVHLNTDGTKENK